MSAAPAQAPARAGAMAAFRRMLDDGSLTADPPQRAVADRLDALAARLTAPKPRLLRLPGLSRLARRGRQAEPGAQGLYLHGRAGRGKSMLMDIFFAGVAVERKRRVHFHAFMQEMHAGIDRARKTAVEDPVRHVADHLADQVDLLCFDEVQITDITDAMLVGRLFQRLFDRGVVMVATSNRHPDDLFKEGWNRGPFLPFIALLKDRLEVVQLDGPADHRRNRRPGPSVWFAPLGPDAAAAIEGAWRNLRHGEEDALVLRVHGREIRFPRHAGGVLRAGFAELCGQPHGPAEFLALAGALEVLILEEVPILSARRNNEAHRLIVLIDALYEAGVKLVVSAAAEPDQLYPEGAGTFEFGRTASRLEEMRSQSWWD